MNKLIIALLFLSVSLFARQEAFPSQECPAYNNMKHTKNTHNVLLDMSKKYTILNQQKGQSLILVTGEQPAQRWVDDACFASSENTEKVVQNAKPVSIDKEFEKASKSMNISKHTNKYKNIDSNKYVTQNATKQNLLALSWHNAFCETHRYKKECKRSFTSLLRSQPHETQFVLHGLWPQPKNNVYCNVDKKLIYADKDKRWSDLPSLALDDEVAKSLEQVMPGFDSQLHKHEWVKHGTCYGTDVNRYYADAISLVKQVNDSALGRFFTENIGKQVSLKEFRMLADKTFGRSAGNRVEFQCKGGMITELWLHLGSGSDDLGTLLKRGKPTYSRCQKGQIDKAGFGR